MHSLLIFLILFVYPKLVDYKGNHFQNEVSSPQLNFEIEFNNQKLKIFLKLKSNFFQFNDSKYLCHFDGFIQNIPHSYAAISLCNKRFVILFNLLFLNFTYFFGQKQIKNTNRKELFI